jgi:hypothetical protein
MYKNTKDKKEKRKKEKEKRGKEAAMDDGWPSHTGRKLELEIEKML